MQFVTAATLVAMLAKAHGDGSLDKQPTQLSRPKLLIIDELGAAALMVRLHRWVAVRQPPASPSPRCHP